MIYQIEYQYRPKGRARPVDDGNLVPFKIDEDTAVVLLPNIGDHVYIGATSDSLSAFGKVASRLFSYQQTASGQVFCHVNIVVEECDDTMGNLIKE